MERAEAETVQYSLNLLPAELENGWQKPQGLNCICFLGTEYPTSQI